MNTTIRAGLAAILMLAISCKKENDVVQNSPVTKNSNPDVESAVTGKYSSIKIGKQVWMQQNLFVSHYRNGDRIPQVKDPGQWAALTTGAWCWYNNDSANGVVYGKLYNWYAVHDPRGLAPTGWHIPDNAEWDSLAAYLVNNVGGKLKDTGTIESGTGLWHAPNFQATNESGFTALPGGYHSVNGDFYVIGNDGYWWSSTESDATNSWYHHLSYISRKLQSAYAGKANGLSVRCVRD